MYVKVCMSVEYRGTTVWALANEHTVEKRRARQHVLPYCDLNVPDRPAHAFTLIKATGMQPQCKRPETACE